MGHASVGAQNISSSGEEMIRECHLYTYLLLVFID